MSWGKDPEKSVRTARSDHHDEGFYNLRRQRMRGRTPHVRFIDLELGDKFPAFPRASWSALQILEPRDKNFKVPQTLPQLVIEGIYRAALVPRGWPADNNGGSSRGAAGYKCGRGTT